MTTVTSPPDGAPEQTLAARYGRKPSANRRTGAVTVSLLAAIVLVWAIWAAHGQTRDSVGGIVQSFDVTSPHAISVTVQISRTSGRAVQCTISAIASDHSDVGEVVVRIPVGSSGTQTITRLVKTEREATSADIAGCS